jgi:outer membrane protein assembly factor BamD
MVHGSSSSQRGSVRGVVLVGAMAVLLALPLGACSTVESSFGKWFGNSDDVNLPDQPPEKLYNEGLYLLNEKSDIGAAAKKFEEVDRQHPYSDWARKALLMQAYTHYEAREYDEAISAAQRYVSLHPGNPDAAYAEYLIASSHYDQIPDVTRDQATTEKAIAELEEIVRRFPDSQYAGAARDKIKFARDQLAGREMNVGRYYLERRDYTGAINRFKVVATRYQTTRHVEEALMRLTEAYLALGIVHEAQTAAAVLGHNFPDSRWYKDAYRLVRSGGLEPVEHKGSWISRAFSKLGLG